MSSWENDVDPDIYIYIEALEREFIGVARVLGFDERAEVLFAHKGICAATCAGKRCGILVQLQRNDGESLCGKQVFVNSRSRSWCTDIVFASR